MAAVRGSLKPSTLVKKGCRRMRATAPSPTASENKRPAQRVDADGEHGQQERRSDRHPDPVGPDEVLDHHRGQDRAQPHRVVWPREAPVQIRPEVRSLPDAVGVVRLGVAAAAPRASGSTADSPTAAIWNAGRRHTAGRRTASRPRRRRSHRAATGALQRYVRAGHGVPPALGTDGHGSAVAVPAVVRVGQV